MESVLVNVANKLSSAPLTVKCDPNISPLADISGAVTYPNEPVLLELISPSTVNAFGGAVLPIPTLPELAT